MKQTIELVIPTEWKDVSLHSYLELQRELENYKEEEEAHIKIMLYHLCGIDYDVQAKLSVNTMNGLKEKLSRFQKPEDLPLQRIITIDGVEYGFEPNLSEMAYGAYVDISSFEQLSIDKNWHKIMSILYRKVINKKGELYQIEPYTGNEDTTIWKWVDMGVHWGTLFFFINLWRDLLHATLNSLKDLEIPRNIKSILEKSGKGIAQSLNWQGEISALWEK